MKQADNDEIVVECFVFHRKQSSGVENEYEQNTDDDDLLASSADKIIMKTKTENSMLSRCLNSTSHNATQTNERY